MIRSHSIRPSIRVASANLTSGIAARNNRRPANTAKGSSAWTQDPTAGQWVGFAREVIDAGIDPADLVSVAAAGATDHDYLHHSQDLISCRACKLAQHACSPTAAATLQAIQTHAVVLSDAGHHQRAAHLWRQLVTRHQIAGQPGLAQRAQLAYVTGLHWQGRCIEALDQISIAWQNVTEAVDEHSPAAPTVLRMYRLMLDACHPGVNTTPARPVEPDQAPQSRALLDTPSVTGVLEHRRVCAYRSRSGSRAGR